MKVLHINSVCGTGSTGRIAADLCRESVANGNECRVAYGRSITGCEDITTMKIGNALDHYLHGLLTRIFDLHGFGSKRATRKFIEEVRKYDPDVVHLHNIHGYYINVEILFNYLRKENKKVFWTLHDFWAITGHCAFFENANCDKWIAGCYKCPIKREYPSSFLFDRSKQNYRKKKSLFTGIRDMTVVTSSQWVADTAAKSFLGKYPIEVRYNKIDLSAFSPTESDFRRAHGLVDKKIVLGVAFVWARDRKYDDFVALSSKLSQDYQMVLVGLGPKQIAKLPQKIMGIPKTNSKKELAEIYTAADVFINPTYEDTYPTVNLEAQACGTPVITYNSGGSAETIRGGAGHVIQKGDMKALYEKVIEVCSASSRHRGQA